MKLSYIATFLFTLLIAPFLVAGDECLMVGTGVAGFNPGDVHNDGKICQSTGKNDFTFAMVTSSTSFGAPGTIVDSTIFVILDYSCTVLSTYVRPKCGIPWGLHQANFPYEIIISNVYMNIGDPYFAVKYGAGVYEVGKNQVACFDISDGIHISKACKAAIPLNG